MGNSDNVQGNFWEELEMVKEKKQYHEDIVTLTYDCGSALTIVCCKPYV